MKQYLDLLYKVKNSGSLKLSRAGRTVSLFSQNLLFRNIHQAFPLMTTKYMNWKSIVAEFLWILSGEAHINNLSKQTSIWNEFANKDGYLDSAYGFNLIYGTSINQIEYVYQTLKDNPYSRRAVMTSWEPENCCNSNLPPCHFAYVFNAESIQYPLYSYKLNLIQYPLYSYKLNLHITQRSGDLALGIPFDIAVWALMLQYMASRLNFIAGDLSFTIVDAHIYENHFEGITEWLYRIPRQLPTVQMTMTTDKYKPLILLLDYVQNNKINFQLNTGKNNENQKMDK